MISTDCLEHLARKTCPWRSGKSQGCPQASLPANYRCPDRQKGTLTVDRKWWEDLCWGMASGCIPPARQSPFREPGAEKNDDHLLQKNSFGSILEIPRQMALDRRDLHTIVAEQSQVGFSRGQYQMAREASLFPGKFGGLRNGVRGR